MRGLVRGVGDSELRVAVRCFAAALSFAALYGVAVGARVGPGEMAAHAAGVPAALLVVCLFGTPAFYILLTHTGVVLAPAVLTAIVCRALATSALVLGGFAPAAALLVVSAETDAGAALAAALGLGAAGMFGVRRLLEELHAHFVTPAYVRALGARGVAFGFAAFASALAARVWWATLPIFGRYSL